MKLVEPRIEVLTITCKLNFEFQLVSSNRQVTYAHVAPTPGPPHVRSGRRCGSFPLRTTWRAFSRRIVSSIWLTSAGAHRNRGVKPDAMRPDARCACREPSGRQRHRNTSLVLPLERRGSEFSEIQDVQHVQGRFRDRCAGARLSASGRLGSRSICSTYCWGGGAAGGGGGFGVHTLVAAVRILDHV